MVAELADRFQYDAVFVDPPFANVQLHDLRRTVDLLASNATQAAAPVYLAFISDREDAVLDAFAGTVGQGSPR